MFSEKKLISMFYDNHPKGVMLDVGAHIGTFSLPFSQAGWQIIAFEPEKENIKEFEKKFGGLDSVKLVKKAVYGKTGESVDFYTSKKHHGIHSLKPFHKTHVKLYKVKTTRLDDYLKEEKLKKVDLLKIDIEGADFLALKTFDFKKYKPKIVMVEFMDSRSEKYFGYTHKDMVQHMNKFGYQAYVSEWDEIKSYAEKGKSIKHKWLGIEKYRGKKNMVWGNIIFVRQDSEERFDTTLSHYLKDYNRLMPTTIIDWATKKLEGNMFTYLLPKVYRGFHNVLATYSWEQLKLEYKLKKYKNKYVGKRCFIIGNGPSLKKVNLKLLRNEYTFGLNRIYLMFKKYGFKTSFFVSVNPLLIKQSKEDINRLNIRKFISWRAKDLIDIDENTMLIKTGGDLNFSKDITKKISEGSTVTFVAMQIAYFMGFEEVVLIGVDHSFKQKGKPGRVVVSKGNDADHFSEKYFGKGFSWQLPDLEVSEAAYRLAKIAFERDGRRIIDATKGGKLDVFAKVDYNNLFK